MAGKKEFQWSSSQQLGSADVNEKEKRVVKLVSMDIEREDETEERWYVSIETWKFFKKKDEPEESWRVVKNATIPLAVWDEINDMVQEACEEE